MEKTYGQLRLVGDTWHIDAEPYVVIRLKRVFEKINKGRFGTVLLSNTPENCRELEWFLQRYPMEVEGLPSLTAGASSHKDEELLVSDLVSGVRKPPPFDLALPPREYQSVAAALVLTTGGAIVADQVGLGKAQPLDSKILTPSGWKRMGNLKVGDPLIDPDGGLSEVTATYDRGVRDSYQITLKDGSSTECCDEHLWIVQTTNDRTQKTDRVLPLKSFKDDLHVRKHKGHDWKTAKYFLPLTKPIEFEDGVLLPLDPYLLGLLLGDGSLRKGSVGFSSADSELLYEVRRRSPSGVTLVKSSRKGYDWRISRNSAAHPNPVLEHLRNLGLAGKLSYEKTVPSIYLYAPPLSRLELLRGLMDTDGDCSKEGTSTFNTSSKLLVDGVVEIVRSLGGFTTVGNRIPKYRYKGELRKGRRAYRVNVRLPFNPFRLQRKAARWKKPYLARAVASVESVGRKRMRCISVSSKRGLYITDDYIVTHNTISAIATFTDPRTLPALVVTLSHLTHQWESEVNRFAPNLKTHILKKTKVYNVKDKEGNFPDVLITTYHKLHGWAEMLAPVLNSVVYDEGHELRRGAQSKKGNAAYHISNNVSFRTATTATPFFNYGGEMYNVMQAVRPGVLGTWAEFFREWCVRSYGEQKARIRDPKAFGSYLREHGLMLRRTREDVGRELPSLSKVPHYVSSDRAALDEISSSASELAKFILDQGPSLKGEKMKAAGELSYKLRQATGLAKAPYVAQFVKMLVESGEKVLLYGWHRSVYDIWQDQLKDFNPVLYTGTESPKQKQKSFNRFANGDTNLIIMSLRSGLGLDGLQHHCKTVVFGELDWSPACHSQCTGRIFRDGQSNPVLSYYLITNTGSDPVIADILGVKKAQIDGVIDPNKPLIEKQRNVDDVRRLAEYYLKQHRRMK